MMKRETSYNVQHVTVGEYKRNGKVSGTEGRQRSFIHMMNLSNIVEAKRIHVYNCIVTASS